MIISRTMWSLHQLCHGDDDDSGVAPNQTGDFETLAANWTDLSSAVVLFDQFQ